MKKNHILALALLVTLISCDKDEDVIYTSEMLTNGSWKLIEYRSDYDKDGVYEENTYVLMGECNTDNIYTFLSNGTFIQDEGPAKCDETYPQTQTYTWSFQDNTASLQMAENKFNIEKLNATTLILTRRERTRDLLFTYDTKFTYTKQ